MDNFKGCRELKRGLIDGKCIRGEGGLREPSKKGWNFFKNTQYQ